MHRPRSLRSRCPTWPATLAMLLPAGAQAAAYLPGAATEADPPTGDLSAAVAAPDTPARGDGIVWAIAPWRRSGSLTFDLRRLRLDDGSRTTAAVAAADIDFASYVWQPWFVQLRAGIGLVAARDSVAGGDQAVAHNGSGAATGRVAIAVFPASRFPFEFRADLSDSRTQGDTLGGDYRTLRLSASQNYRPELGNDHYAINADHSRITLADGSTDTLNLLSAQAVQQYAAHTVEFGGSVSDNERGDGGDSARLAQLSARHGFHPRSELQVDTTATWNDTQLRSGGFEVGTDVRQITTFASWRPRAGEPLYSATAPLQVAATARWVEAGVDGGDAGSAVRAINTTLGLTQDLGTNWRWSASATAGALQDGVGGATHNFGASATVAWTAAPVALGAWRWLPSATGTLGATRASGNDDRRIAGLQFSHSLSRDVTLGESRSLALALSQSLATLRSSMASEDSTAVAHSASAFWQSSGDGRSQSFAGVSISDARTRAQEDGSFRLVNLQWTQREQFSRYTSGSANVTLQATRNDATRVDPFTGVRRDDRAGWQRYYSASVNLEAQRVFDVPRLRFTLIAAANSQDLDRRAAGDIDAPPERISESVEARLDYTVGRLDARLSARAARVEGRTVSALLARVQRRF